MNPVFAFQQNAQRTQASFNTYLVLRPEHTIRFIWEMIMMSSIIILSILTPYSLAFIQNNSSLLTSIDYFSILVFSLDILVSLNTGVYKQGVLYMNRLIIFKQYLKFWLWLDLISTLPFEIIFSESFDTKTFLSAFTIGKSFNFLKLFKMLKLVRLVKLKYLIMRIEDHISSKKLLSLLKILKLGLYLFLVANFFACMMFLTSYENISPESFINLLENTKNGYNSNLDDMYVFSLYWALTTMVAVGYGDYSPQSPPERMLGIASMSVSSIVFGFILGNVGNIIEKHTVKDKQRREHMVSMNKYLKLNKISSDLQRKTRDYIEYIYSHSKSRVNLSDLLAVLSRPLREEIYSYINGENVRSLKFLKDFSKISISHISKALRPQVNSPLEMIFIEKDNPDGMYFITKGCIYVIDHNSKSCVKILSIGSYFGEIGLFTGENRCASIQSVSFLETLFLHIKDLETISKQFPEVKTKFDAIKDSCSLGDLSSLRVKCYLCKQLGHISKNCKKMTERDILRGKWLSSRRESQLVNAENYGFKNNFTRKLKKLKIKVLKTRNVFGLKRRLYELYPKQRRFVRSIRDYLRGMPKKSDDDSILSDQVSMISQESDISIWINNTKNLMMLLSDSSEDELPKVQNLRSLKFDSELLGISNSPTLK